MSTMTFVAAVQPVIKGSERGFWAKAWIRFCTNKLALVSLGLLVILSLIAILAPWIAPHDPNKISLARATLLQSPSRDHLFGTDELGRDALSRAMFGVRISLAVGFVAAGVAVSIGVLVGATAGLLGGWVDLLLMRLVDVLLSVPLFFLLMIAQTALPTGIFTIMAVIGLISWMDISRMVRGEFLKLRATEFTAAAKVVGVSGWRLGWRHLLPNASGPIIVAATLRVAEAILVESTLSFIGLGIQPPNASLGSMLQKGLVRLLDAPWLVWFPGILIGLIVLSFNFVGDGIRDALDVRGRRT
jgi:peptide/nickel transport system permease protein